MDAPQKLVIDVVGLAGSGKSRLCAELAEKFGFELYRASDTLRRYAIAHDIALQGREDYVAVHHMMIRDDPLAIIEPVLTSEEKRICLDGMRAPLPYLTLRERYGATLIYLDCPDDIRLRRLQSDTTRPPHRRPADLQALLLDEAPDMANSDRNLPNMIEMKHLANYIVDASKPADEVFKQAGDIVQSLLA